MKENLFPNQNTEKGPRFDQIDKVWTESFANIQRIRAKSGNLVLGTEVGGRKRNEDRALLNTELDVFGVVDGMGGYPHGDVASLIVAEEILKGVKDQLDPQKMQFNAFMRMKQEHLFDDGACYVAGRIIGKKLHVWSAGDAQLMVVDEKGKIKFRSEITDLHLVPRGKSSGSANMQITNLMNYDRIYAFTDGVSDNVEIESVVAEFKGAKVEEAIQKIAEMAKEQMKPANRLHNIRSNPDNVTILIYEILPVPLRGK